MSKNLPPEGTYRTKGEEGSEKKVCRNIRKFVGRNPNKTSKFY